MSQNLLTLDPEKLKSLLIAGCKNIIKNYEYIDELNVFPVPDGDTGTNMKITFESAMNIIENNSYTDIKTLSSQFARNLLLNARGNSGVISSQIFSGFAKAINDGEVTLNIETFCNCLVSAKDVAYRAVTKPTEGTMLTVIRIISEEINKKKNSINDMYELLKNIVEIAEKALASTPDLLPILKEVGVVDSGGYGICKFFQGMLSAISSTSTSSPTPTANISKNNVTINNPVFNNNFVDNNEGFGYCTEFIMTIGSKVEYNQANKKKIDLSGFKNKINKMGDSVVFVNDNDIIKVHIHTTEPYNVLKYAAQYGEFDKIKIENMTNQFLEKNPGMTLEGLHQNKNKKVDRRNEVIFSNETKIVVTVPSFEFSEIFKKKFNIENVINTKNIGNPSIKVILNEIYAAKSNRIILILDDTNYILAANEACKLLPKNINVSIIKCSNISQSYDACMAYIPHATYEKNVKALNNSLKASYVCLISMCVKDVKFSNISIKKGEYIGIVENKKIVCSGKNISDTAKKLFD